MNSLFDKILYYIKKLVPASIFKLIAPIYHYLWALVGAFVYRFPSNQLFVIGITGTKGKTTTVEVVNAILEGAGYKTAVASTFRFKIGDDSRRNLLKMTMPGRMMLQKFMREAVDKGCTHLVLEMSSEGVLQYRHKFISLNAFIFTNLSPEHIEAHGSYENYRDAKLKLAKALERSRKKKRYMVANIDDEEAEKFLAVKVNHKATFGFNDINELVTKGGKSTFRWRGIPITSHLPGDFNVYNVLAGMTLAESIGIDKKVIQQTIKNLKGVRGRMERVIGEDANGNEFEDFEVIVDYAHTADSLLKVYESLNPKKKICILGGTGGGRDRWKRSLMGAIAGTYCKEIILTNEDPYDEDPYQIINDVKLGVDKKIKTIQQEGGKIPALKIILDRKEAIETGIADAKKNEVIIITGKGTDPYIMGPKGEKTPWDDATVAKTALQDFLAK
ncbi:hypothetical protein CL654_00835 [bacterium]|nr:hypothetical protein [bacterium]|tara:strand:- start:873 stop:2207 length:1335 start_codon:yes stop_codon:yes gene_type:complete